MKRSAAIAAVMALTTPTLAAAQDLTSARAFVAKLYRAYERGDPDYLGQDAGKTFSGELLRRIRRDQASTPPDEVGTLDGDPICDCQDAEGLKLKHLDVSGAARGRVQAAATLQFPGGEARQVRLDLVATPQGWRVADVHTKETPSLAGLLDEEAAKRGR
jgi:hypothetical protein